METGVDAITLELDAGTAPLDDDAGGRDALGGSEDDPTGTEKLAEELGSPELLC